MSPACAARSLLISSSHLNRPESRKSPPAYWACKPSSSSMRSSWLYLARRSERQGAPVFRWPVPSATVRSAMKVSSVSPERWETKTPHWLSTHSLYAAIASLIVPIWLTLSSIAFVAFMDSPFATILGFVQYRSSPTISMRSPSLSVSLLWDTKSFSSHGSSSRAIGYLAAISTQYCTSSSPLLRWSAAISAAGFLKSRLYLPVALSNVSEAAGSEPMTIRPV
mmetsp:Transcript_17996/g.46506  ORF Transcript_17996/g.46506 Transcript_17996/m.46506 type:complete len:223 (-) Transcript_17996:737-1405(-)